MSDEIDTGGGVPNPGGQDAISGPTSSQSVDAPMQDVTDAANKPPPTKPSWFVGLLRRIEEAVGASPGLDEPPGDDIDPRWEPRLWAHHFLWTVLAAGIILLLIFAVSVTRGDRLEAVAVVGGLGGAALVTGGLLGFLFAFPRFGVDTAAGHYVPNTNLEQISDWVTKILVGIGLIQAQALGQLYARLMREASRSIDGTDSHAVTIGALVVFALLPGFFVGFIQARVALPGWFITADQIARHEKELLALQAEASNTPPAVEGTAE